MNQFSIDRRSGVLLVRFAGAVTVESLRAFDEEVKALIAAEGPRPAIIDFAEVSSVDVETTAVVDRGGSPRLMAGQPRVFVSPTLCCSVCCASTALTRKPSMRRPRLS